MSLIPVRKRVTWKLREVRRAAVLTIPSGSRVGYIGWVGHRNMGDEASYLAYRRALPGCTFAPVPSPRMLRALDRLLPHAVVRAGLLGGGTLVGWPLFRRPLTALLEAGERPAFMLGTGVEDPDFSVRVPIQMEALERGEREAGVRRPRASRDVLVRRELGRWAEVLARFEAVRVRGPHSAEIVRSLGLEAEVVGDPALLLADDRPSQRDGEQLLGLNVGVADGLWGDRPDRVLDMVVELGRNVRKRGWRVRFIPTWPGDVSTMREAARRIGPEVTVFDEFLDLPKLLEALRQCHVFVGEKLHSVILATAVYTPSLALEYHPKCADFQCSVGREEFTLRTDDLTLDKLVERVDDLAMRRDHHRATLFSAVTALRVLLEAHVLEIRRSLSAIGLEGAEAPLGRRSR